MVDESFIEVEDVVLRVHQPSGAPVEVHVGRISLTEAGRKEASTLKASVPDFDGSLANKIRAKYECELLALAASEQGYRLIFSGTVSDVAASPWEADTLDVTAHDWWKALSGHRVTMRRLGIDVADAIQLILDGNAAGITAGDVASPYGETLDEVHFDYLPATQCIYELMDRVDADAFIDASRSLHFFPRGATSSGLQVVDDGSGTMRPKFRESDAMHATRIRGFGGHGYAEFHSHLAEGATKIVTTTAKIQHRIDFPLPELARLILKVERVPGSTDYLEVAIQNNKNDAPNGVDVVKAVVSWQDQPETLAEVTIDFPSHVVAEVEPWIVIRASGPSGVKVAVASTTDDEPYSKFLYKHPVIVEVHDAEAVAKYGYIDAEVKNPQVTSRGEMLAICRAELDRRKEPQRSATIKPTDPAWLDAPRGSTVQVTAPVIGVADESWGIEKKQHEFNGGGIWLLTCELSAVISPPDVSILLKDQDDRIRRLERKLVPTHNADVTRYLATPAESDNASDAGAFIVAGGTRTLSAAPEREDATDESALVAAAQFSWGSGSTWALFAWGTP